LAPSPQQVAALAEEVGFPPGCCVAAEGTLLCDLFVVAEGAATFRRGGVALCEKAGPGAYWGDLSLVQGPRLCQVRQAALSSKTHTHL
jgi:hypothetical protein